MRLETGFRLKSFTRPLQKFYLTGDPLKTHSADINMTEGPIAKQIVAGKYLPGATIKVTAEGGRIMV